MNRKNIIIAVALAAAVGAAALTFGSPSFAQPYSGGWGYYPSGGIGLLLIILIVLLFAGRI